MHGMDHVVFEEMYEVQLKLICFGNDKYNAVNHLKHRPVLEALPHMSQHENPYQFVQLTRTEESSFQHDHGLCGTHWPIAAYNTRRVSVGPFLAAMQERKRYCERLYDNVENRKFQWCIDSSLGEWGMLFTITGTEGRHVVTGGLTYTGPTNSEAAIYFKRNMHNMIDALKEIRNFWSVST